MIRRIAGLALAALVLALAPAKADMYTLTIDHCTGGCGTSPFGTITIDQNGTDTVHFVISLNNGGEFVLTGQNGGGSTLAFNIDGNPLLSLSNATLPGWSLDSAMADSIHFDGFGNFEYSLNCCFSQNGGAHSQPGFLEFDLIGTGLTPASFHELSTGGSPSVYFALDFAAANGVNTGPVGAVTASTVPEPGSVFLLLAVLSLTALPLAKRSRT